MPVWMMLDRHHLGDPLRVPERRRSAAILEDPVLRRQLLLESANGAEGQGRGLSRRREVSPWRLSESN